MQKYSISIVFDHRNRTAEGKEGPLEVCITQGKTRTYINTGVRVRRKEWAGSVVNRSDADALNERIGQVVQAVSHEVNSMQAESIEITAAAIRERVFEGEKKNKEADALLSWVDEQIPQLKMTEGTRARYEVMDRRLREFGKIRNWDDLTVENLYAWDSWLHKIKRPQTMADVQAGKKAEKICDASVYNYHRCLHALISRAMKMGKVETNVYDRVRGDFRKGVKENVEYLTEEEMSAVISLHPVPGSQMASARDLFVFQLFTGLSYSDAQAFDIKKYKNVDGKWVRVGERIKTGVSFVSQLLPPAVEVLERYGMQVPKIGNADYNHALKAIQMAAGIQTRMHSHLARHTFATYMLRNGVKIENLAKMMGHSTIRETQKYAKVLAQSVHEEFDMIAGKIDNLTKTKRK